MTFCGEKSFLDGVQLVRNMTLFHFPDGFVRGRRRIPVESVVRRRQQHHPQRGSTHSPESDRRSSCSGGKTTQELKARLLRARHTGSKPSASEAFGNKRDSILEAGPGSHLARFLPRTKSGIYHQLDQLTDTELRTFAAERRVSVAEHLAEKRAGVEEKLVHILLFGDFALQSLDMHSLQTAGKSGELTDTKLFIIGICCTCLHVHFLLL
jgi:hypothetical protein